MVAKYDCSDKKELGRALFAEFIGMAFFIFIGVGSAMSAGTLNITDGGTNNTTKLMPVAMNFGIGFVVLLYCIAGISGGHLNPAVTLFLATLKRTSPGRAACYIAVQFAGSIFGSFILWACTSDIGVRSFHLGTTHLNDELNPGQGLMFEIIGTMLVCMTVFFTEVRVGGPTDGKPNLSLLCIGLSVFLAHIVLLPYTGCGINPARTFGPALVGIMENGNDDEDVYFGPDAWIYYLGPVMGALMVTGMAMFFGETHDDAEEKLTESNNPSESL